MTHMKKVWDVIVIGGGPAGMMAAATAAHAGVSVLLLEKNPDLGKKLSMTGGGRCNVTNNKPVVREILSVYQEAGKFLFSTFTQHGVTETIAWFRDRGVAFKEENDGRLFPTTDSAETIRKTLVQALQEQRVTIQSQQVVSGVMFDKRTGVFTISSSGERLYGETCILATGGYARPETGSTGDGFSWLNALGHTIKPYDDAIVPLALKTLWTRPLSGLTLEQVNVGVWADGKKRLEREGRVLFTHVGVSGPLILNMSKQIGDLLSYTDVTLKLDLFPQLDAGALKSALQSWLQSNKRILNVLAEVLPRQLARAILTELRIDEETPCHSVRTTDRKALAVYLKAVPLPVAYLLGSDKAVISSGGVVLEEVDFRTMSSRIVPGLFIVGDLLNINRPSGGYSLQLCWSTGYVAGLKAATVLLQRRKGVGD